MDRKISEILTEAVVTVSASLTIKRAVAIMREKRISCLIVVKSGEPVGIYTEKDIVRALNKQLDMDRVQLSEVMSYPVLTASKEISAYEASFILKTNSIRHLVLTDAEGKMAGVVTQTDIVSRLGVNYYVGVKTVDHVMTKRILMVSPEETLKCVIFKMENIVSGCAIVEQNGRPVGMLTERDMAALILRGCDLETTPVKEVMSSPVISVKYEVSTYGAVDLMNRHKMRRLVVVDSEERVVGLLLQDNIIKELEDSYVDFLKRMLVERDRSLDETRAAYNIQSLYLENILRSSIDMGIIATDLDFYITYFNPEAERIFGVDVSGAVGTCMIAMLFKEEIDPVSLENCKERIENNGESCFSFNKTVKGKVLNIEARITAIRDGHDQGQGYTLTCRDVTEVRKSQEKLILASHVYESAIEGIIVTDAEGVIQSVNPAFTTITGYSEDEAVGRNPRFLQSNRQGPEFYQEMWSTLLAKGYWQGELWNRRKNGETFLERITITTVKDADDEIRYFTAVFYDITDVRQREEEIAHRAYHDPLTDLPNRLLFQDRLSQAIARAHRKGRKLAVMFLDVDRFKQLNDSLGHYAGDLFLQYIAKKFKSTLREGDTVARFGGDEFTVLMEDIHEVQDAVVVARKIIAIFDQPMEYEGHKVELGTSIGLSIYPLDGCDACELIKQADTAMYYAKAQGPNHYRFFEREMESRIKERANLETDLRRALQEGQFQLRYQPIIDIKDQDTSVMEVLLRWNRPGTGVVSPERFISVAEESGLIMPLGDWVLNEACEQAKKFEQDSGKSVSISINLSARQFRDKGLVGRIRQALDKSGLDAESLYLEITEAMISDNLGESVLVLEQIREMGVRISMDDFGAGYSSFTSLKRVPVDVIKLDISFVKDIVNDSDAERLAAGVISLAKGLRLQVVAEGVETAEQLEILAKYGCDKAQGYFFHRPLLAEDAARLFCQ